MGMCSPGRAHTQVAVQESWGLRQGNADFNTLWAGGDWSGARCTRCRAWEMQVGAACEPAMWLDASACFDDSQVAADAARRTANQSMVRFVVPSVATDKFMSCHGRPRPAPQSCEAFARMSARSGTGGVAHVNYVCNHSMAIAII